IDRTLFRLLDHKVRAKVLEGQAHRFLIGRGDGVDRDKKGDAYRDAEHIHQGTMVVMAKLVKYIAIVHGVLTFSRLPGQGPPSGRPWSTSPETWRDLHRLGSRQT